MASETTFRPGRTAPEQQARPWWRRLPVRPAQPSPAFQHACLERLLTLLEAARSELSAGWVQGGWLAVTSPGRPPTVLTGPVAGASIRGPVSAVCLVGALIRAGSGAASGAASSGPAGDSESGRAIDAAYDALWESRGQPPARPGPGLLMVSSPQVRRSRVQALTRWNDAPGRTREDVLGVLDQAIARVIQDLAAIPGPGAAWDSPRCGRQQPASANMTLAWTGSTSAAKWFTKSSSGSQAKPSLSMSR